MHHFEWLEQALILLLATVVAVPLFLRLKLGAVLAYLCAGALLGPHALAAVEGGTAQTAVAELGVVLLMFLVGLELSLSRLWLMRRAVFGVGLLQFGATTLALTAIGMVLGTSWKVAVVASAALALSSTAIGVQILAERKTLGEPHGRNALGILLMQDLAAIPALTLIPLLATSAAGSGFSLLAIGKALGSVLAVVVIGRYLVRPLFRICARTRSVEVFTAATLMVALGTAWITGLAGLSMPLGAFLAGILLADSEYRHEIEAQIAPFKGLLLGLFFFSVGMSVDWSLVLRHSGMILAAVSALVVVKGAILYFIGRHSAAMDRAESLRLAALIAQGGEFAFVLLALAADVAVLDPRQRDLLSAVVVLSMALTPLLVLATERFASRLAPAERRPYDTLPDDHAPRVVVAGFGRVGQIVGRMLRANRIPFVALEQSVEQVDLSRRFGSMIYYGDPASPETLRAARVDLARVFVLAMDNPEESLRVAALVRRQYPDLRIVARARNRQHVYALWEVGVSDVVRETFFSSLRIAGCTLKSLGVDATRADERMERFRQHDEAMLRAQYQVRNDEAQLIQTSKQTIAELQAIFDADPIEDAVDTNTAKP